MNISGIYQDSVKGVFFSFVLFSSLLWYQILPDNLVVFFWISGKKSGVCGYVCDFCFCYFFVISDLTQQSFYILLGDHLCNLCTNHTRHPCKHFVLLFWHYCTIWKDHCGAVCSNQACDWQEMALQIQGSHVFFGLMLLKISLLLYLPAGFLGGQYKLFCFHLGSPCFWMSLHSHSGAGLRGKWEYYWPRWKADVSNWGYECDIFYWNDNHVQKWYWKNVTLNRRDRQRRLSLHRPPFEFDRPLVFGHNIRKSPPVWSHIY